LGSLGVLRIRGGGMGSGWLNVAKLMAQILLLCKQTAADEMKRQLLDDICQ